MFQTLYILTIFFFFKSWGIGWIERKIRFFRFLLSDFYHWKTIVFSCNTCHRIFSYNWSTTMVYGTSKLFFGIMLMSNEKHVDPIKITLGWEKLPQMLPALKVISTKSGAPFTIPSSSRDDITILFFFLAVPTQKKSPSRRMRVVIGAPLSDLITFQATNIWGKLFFIRMLFILESNIVLRVLRNVFNCPQSCREAITSWRNQYKKFQSVLKNYKSIMFWGSSETLPYLEEFNWNAFLFFECLCDLIV